MTRALIVAEVGVNHGGDLDRAFALVEAAAQAGADAVKFQTFSAERIVVHGASKADYQVGHSPGSDQFEMLKSLELSAHELVSLKNSAERLGLEFMSTPFDETSLEFLVHEVHVKTLKVSSGDLTNLPLLHAIGQIGLPVVLSTGMATLCDISLALGALGHGRALGASVAVSPPSPDGFLALGSHPEWFNLLQDVTLLHCTSEYPTPDVNANLRAIRSLREAYHLPTGFSDHTEGTHLSVAAVALGAVVIEKHITWSNQADGPDHRSSLEVEAFSKMVQEIRSLERALGSGFKVPTEHEQSLSRQVRRGVYAARDIPAGTRVGPADVAILRPENGVHPKDYWQLIGCTATRPLRAGQDLRT